MNILFTCAGRRNYLLRYFREELNGHGKIFAADMSDTAPALHEADESLQVPALVDDSYISTLLALCADNAIDLIISLNDVELPILAAHKNKFERQGTRLLLSSPEVIDICFDKLKTCEFLRNAQIKCPVTYYQLTSAEEAVENNTLQYPLFVKPRWGSASMQIFRVDTAGELKLAYQMAQMQLQKTFLKVDDALISESILIQEGLPGIEYGIDILNDLDGRVCSVYVKRKLGMRAGETDKSEMVDIPELYELGERLGSELGHIGNLDCDVFFDGKSAAVLEMNPRFGGGYPFTHTFGANYPNRILHWYRKDKFPKKDFSKNIGQIVCKHDNLIVVGK